MGWSFRYFLWVCEIAVCRAPGLDGAHPARLITPDDMSLEVRGSGSNTRHVCNILPETEPADSLLVVEVITESGNWSSYPPHKHDTDDLPNESYLEETYYHRIDPPQGYVMHRVYNDDRSLDESMAAGDRSVVLVLERCRDNHEPRLHGLLKLGKRARRRRHVRRRRDRAQVAEVERLDRGALGHVDEPLAGHGEQRGVVPSACG